MNDGNGAAPVLNFHIGFMVHFNQIHTYTHKKQLETDRAAPRSRNYVKTEYISTKCADTKGDRQITRREQIRLYIFHIEFQTYGQHQQQRQRRKTTTKKKTQIN